MGKLISILLDNFIYVAFACILLILALIGYIVDSSKTKKLKSELRNNTKETVELTLPKMDSNVTLGSSLNNATTNNAVKEETPQNVGETFES